MNEKDMIQLKQSITMPADMADTLLKNCTSHTKHRHYGRYSKLCAVLVSLLLITAVGSTSMAAYNVYQEKQLAIFMDSDLTQEEITAIGEELARIPGLSPCRYVSGDEAWEEFSEKYLGSLADSFETNPLANSFNYQVSIRLDADTQAVREQISQIDGVRLITTIRELEKSGNIN